MRQLLFVLLLLWLEKVGGLEFISGLSDVYTVLGKPLWWTCSARRTNFRDYLSYQWRFQGRSISPDHLGIVDHGNGTILIQGVKNSNFGQYTCTVSDGSQSIESRAWLRQSYTASTVSVDAISQSIRVGSEKSLVCRFNAQPPASFTWFFNGKEIPESLHNIIIVQEQNQSALQISKIGYDNSGVYLCQVHHELLIQSLLSQTISLQVFGKPQLSNPLTPKNVPIGYNASFRCPAQGDPQPDIVWTFVSSSSPLQTFRLSPDTVSSISLGSSTISVEEDGITLNVMAAENANSGTFTCQWSNIHGSVTTDGLLTVSNPQRTPVITKPLENITVVFEGSTLELDCIGTGNPTPTITWSIQDGGEIVQLFSSSVNFHDNRFITSNRTLVIRNIKRGYSGRRIICLLMNTEGSSTSDTFLDVYFKPNVINLPESVIVDQGSTVEIFCHVEGNPIPSVIWLLPWFHNQDSDSDSLHSVLWHNDSHLVTQSIDQSYQGLYACQATNIVGSLVAYTSLTVRGPPVIVKAPSSIGAVENEKVEMVCPVAGYPLPSIAWHFLALPDPAIEAVDMASVIQYALFDKGNWTGGSMIDMNTNSNEGVEIGDISLLFSQAHSSDTGLYRCSAENAYGIKKAVAFLRVVTPPKFVSRPMHKIAIPGDDVVLNCISTGVPVPTQRWLFNDRTIDANDRNVVLSNGSLIISSILKEEFGNYTCLATNAQGQRSATANVRMSSKPIFHSPPRNSNFIEFQRGMLDCAGNSSKPFITSWFKSKPTGDGFDFLGDFTSLVEQTAMSSEISDQTQRDIPRINIENNGSLSFNCVEMSDESWYYCQLQNEDGLIKSDTVLVNITNSFPRKIDIKMPSSALADGNVQITCTVISSSLLSITWITPKATEVNSSNSDNYPGVDVSDTTQRPDHLRSVLSINGLSNENHGGKWACKACSETGCSLTDSELSIEGPPVISDIIGGISGGRISFQCLTIGKPTPNITFFFNGSSDVGGIESHRLIVDTLVVQEDQMKTEYVCAAVNSYGSSKPVSVNKPPQMTVIKLLPFKNHITIKAMANLPLPHLLPRYVVLEYKEDGEEDWRYIQEHISRNMSSYHDVYQSGTYEINPSCSDVKESVERVEIQDRDNIEIDVASNGQYYKYLFQLQLHSLSPHTIYSIRTAMVNHLGRGVFSPVVQVITLSSAPPSPENITVVVLNREARISWTLPDSMNGRREDINVEAELFQNHNRSPVRSKRLPAIAGDPILTFYNLDISEYKVELKTVNQRLNESSDAVSQTFVIEMQVPSFIPEIIQIKSVAFYQATITWTVPENDSEVLPPILAYSLVLSPQEGQTSDITVDVLGANTSSVTLRQLEERHVYTVRIASRNALGVGSYSANHTFTTAYAPFSELVLGTADLDNTSWKLIAVAIVAALVPMGIFGVIVAIIIQVKMNKRGHAEITSELNDDTGVLHEQDLTANELEGVINSNFMMY